MDEIFENSDFFRFRNFQNHFSPRKNYYFRFGFFFYPRNYLQNRLHTKHPLYTRVRPLYTHYIELFPHSLLFSNNYIHMHIRIYTGYVYMRFCEKKMCICGYVYIGLERFLGCVYAVFQENNISLLDYIMPGSIRNERKLD